MPTLMARDCSPELVTRVRRYARQHPDRTVSASIAELVRVGLETLEARAAGGRTTQARMTPEARSAAMRQLALRRHHPG